MHANTQHNHHDNGLNRFHWFGIALFLFIVICTLFFFKVAALAQCVSNDLICITAP